LATPQLSWVFNEGFGGLQEAKSPDLRCLVPCFWQAGSE